MMRAAWCHTSAARFGSAMTFARPPRVHRPAADPACWDLPPGTSIRDQCIWLRAITCKGHSQCPSVQLLRSMLNRNRPVSETPNFVALLRYRVTGTSPLAPHGVVATPRTYQVPSAGRQTARSVRPSPL